MPKKSKKNRDIEAEDDLVANIDDLDLEDAEPVSRGGLKLDIKGKAPPIENKKTFHCDVCHRQYETAKQFDAHQNSAVHKKNKRDLERLQKTAKPAKNIKTEKPTTGPGTTSTTTSTTTSSVPKPLPKKDDIVPLDQEEGDKEEATIVSIKGGSQGGKLDLSDAFDLGDDEEEEPPEGEELEDLPKVVKGVKTPFLLVQTPENGYIKEEKDDNDSDDDSKKKKNKKKVNKPVVKEGPTKEETTKKKKKGKSKGLDPRGRPQARRRHQEELVDLPS